MTWLDAIATHIQTNSLGTKGTDLFIGQLPDISGISTVLTQYDGSVQELFKGGQTIEVPSLQIRVRGTKDEYVNTLTRCADIRDLLVDITNTTVNSVVFLRIKPTGTINSLGLDENRRYQFTANFEVFLG